jgi:3-dehydroquinate dehydratase/shikimate dehydrogenase
MLPVVGLGLGRCGLTFSLLGRKYGSPWIYAALEKGMEAFPGQPTVGELDEIYRWRNVDSKTRFIGIVGEGIEEQATSRILNAAFDLAKMNMRCLPLDFKSMSQIPKMLDILKIPAVIATPQAGRRMMELATAADDQSTAAQFTDVVIKRADGWHAHNLIWKSPLRALENKLGKRDAEDRPLERRNVMIVGSGGLAVSVAEGVRKRQGLVSICSGDDVAAQKIAQALDIRFVPAAKLYDTLVDVVIFTVGSMDHGSKKSPLNPTMLREGITFMDLSQMPAESPMADEAAARGCKVVSIAEVFADYVDSLFKSLTGENMPPDAIEAGLSQ